jgi:hypothetical protein
MPLASPGSIASAEGFETWEFPPFYHHFRLHCPSDQTHLFGQQGHDRRHVPLQIVKPGPHTAMFGANRI